MAYPYNNYKPKTQNNPNSAANKFKNYEYGTIAVTVQPGKGLDLKTKQPYKVINLYNVDKDSAKEIVARLTDPSKPRVTKTAWIDKLEPTHVQIKVFDSEIDSWLDGGDLNAIQSVLLKSGQYDNNEVMHLEDEIATGFYSKNKEKIQKAHTEAGENAMQMWQNYLSKINDPVTLEQIKLYSRVYGNVTYGHVLSIKNASLIKSYDKDATFVLAPGKWKSLFGRGIKRGAKPLPLYVFVPNNQATAKDLENAKIENGWEQTNVDDLSVQVKNDLNMKATKGGGIVLKSVGYDVRDTYLLSGAKEDKWTSQIGLLNNLNGELNQAAIRDKQQRSTANNDTTIDGADEMLKRTEKACTWMEQFCQQNGYNVQSLYQDASNKLADYLLTYFTANATKKANILREDNIKVYSENATQVTLILTHLAYNALSRFHSTYTYDKKEATALMNVVFGIAKQLEENAVITESIMSWIKDKFTFAKMFLKALRQIGCKVVETKQPEMANAENSTEQSVDDVRNQFNEMFERIDKNYFYNDIKGK